MVNGSFLANDYFDFFTCFTGTLFETVFFLGGVGLLFSLEFTGNALSGKKSLGEIEK